MFREKHDFTKDTTQIAIPEDIEDKQPGKKRRDGKKSKSSKEKKDRELRGGSKGIAPEGGLDLGRGERQLSVAEMQAEKDMGCYINANRYKPRYKPDRYKNIWPFFPPSLVMVLVALSDVVVLLLVFQ